MTRARRLIGVLLLIAGIASFISVIVRAQSLEQCPTSEIDWLWSPPDGTPCVRLPDGRVWAISGWDLGYFAQIGLFQFRVYGTDGIKTWGLYGEAFSVDDKAGTTNPYRSFRARIDALGGRAPFILALRTWAENRLLEIYGSIPRLTYPADAGPGDLLRGVHADMGAWRLDMFASDPVIAIGNALPK